MKEKSNHSVLGGVPKSLPAMIKANRIQEKVKAVGFDWDEPGQIWEKIDEEINELTEVIQSGNTERIEDEFGDLLFSVINASRLYAVDPETALERTNTKFIKRFKFLEEKVRQTGKNFREMKLEEMNEIWEESKKYDQS